VSIAAFAQQAAAFCAWAEGEAGAAHEEAERARRHLAALYDAALQLPETTVTNWETVDPLGFSRRPDLFERFGALPINYYSTVDPLEVPASQLMVGDLADDLRDVYADLIRGVELYQAGRVDAAGHWWRGTFDMHWGKHAAEGIAALHAWFTDHRQRSGPLALPRDFRP
jgi:hypothetical protein